MFVTQDGLEEANGQKVLSSGQHAWSAVKVPAQSPNWFVVTHVEAGSANPCLGAMLVSSTESLYGVLCSRLMHVTAVSLMAFDSKSRGWKQHGVSGIWLAATPSKDALADPMVLSVEGDPTLRTPQLKPVPRAVRIGPCVFHSLYALVWTPLEGQTIENLSGPTPHVDGR